MKPGLGHLKEFWDVIELPSNEVRARCASRAEAMHAAQLYAEKGNLHMIYHMKFEAYVNSMGETGYRPGDPTSQSPRTPKLSSTPTE